MPILDLIYITNPQQLAMNQRLLNSDEASKFQLNFQRIDKMSQTASKLFAEANQIQGLKLIKLVSHLQTELSRDYSSQSDPKV